MVSNIFYFHPYLGKIPNLNNIFQMGWNHQLENGCIWKETIVLDFITTKDRGSPLRLCNLPLCRLPLLSWLNLLGTSECNGAMVFPKNRGGPPKSSILIRFSIIKFINHPFWGVSPPIFGNIYMFGQIIATCHTTWAPPNNSWGKRLQRSALDAYLLTRYDWRILVCLWFLFTRDEI